MLPGAGDIEQQEGTEGDPADLSVPFSAGTTEEQLAQGPSLAEELHLSATHWKPVHAEYEEGYSDDRVVSSLGAQPLTRCEFPSRPHR